MLKLILEKNPNPKEFLCFSLQLTVVKSSSSDLNGNCGLFLRNSTSLRWAFRNMGIFLKLKSSLQPSVTESPYLNVRLHFPISQSLLFQDSKAFWQIWKASNRSKNHKWLWWNFSNQQRASSTFTCPQRSWSSSKSRNCLWRLR